VWVEIHQGVRSAASSAAHEVAHLAEPDADEEVAERFGEALARTLPLGFEDILSTLRAAAGISVEDVERNIVQAREQREDGELRRAIEARESAEPARRLASAVPQACRARVRVPALALLGDE